MIGKLKRETVFTIITLIILTLVVGFSIWILKTHNDSYVLRFEALEVVKVSIPLNDYGIPYIRLNCMVFSDSIPRCGFYHLAVFVDRLLGYEVKKGWLDSDYRFIVFNAYYMDSCNIEVGKTYELRYTLGNPMRGKVKANMFGLELNEIRSWNPVKRSDGWVWWDFN